MATSKWLITTYTENTVISALQTLFNTLATSVDNALTKLQTEGLSVAGPGNLPASDNWIGRKFWVRNRKSWFTWDGAQWDGDTGWSWTPIGVASSWDAKASKGVRRIGRMVEVRIALRRRGTNLTARSDGHLADVKLASLASAFRPTAMVAGAWMGGITGGVAHIKANGDIVLSTMHGGSTLKIMDYAYLQFTYFLD